MEAAKVFLFVLFCGAVVLQDQLTVANAPIQQGASAQGVNKLAAAAGAQLPVAAHAAAEVTTVAGVDDDAHRHKRQDWNSMEQTAAGEHQPQPDVQSAFGFAKGILLAAVKDNPEEKPQGWSLKARTAGMEQAAASRPVSSTDDEVTEGLRKITVQLLSVVKDLVELTQRRQPIPSRDNTNQKPEASAPTPMLPFPILGFGSRKLYKAADDY